MNRCATCKHWGAGEPRRFANWGELRHCAVFTTNNPAPGATISVGGDNEFGDYDADFVTRPSFGCVLWEQKPATAEEEA